MTSRQHRSSFLTGSFQRVSACFTAGLAAPLAVLLIGALVPLASALSDAPDAPDAQDVPPPDRQVDREGNGDGQSATSEPTPAAADDRPRSLDDLLGLEEVADDGAVEADRQRREALQRRLTEGEKRDAFLTAIDDMQRSAELLDEAFDTGIATQRLQESILDRLETLLRQPPRRSQDPSDSSSSEEQSSDPQQAPAQPQPEEGAGAADQQGAQDSEPGDPPPGDASLLEQALEGEGAEWGNLPDRVRDMIRQGLRDRPSSLYERLTEAYYRRLAEESSR